jgi:hypothetical protein
MNERGFEDEWKKANVKYGAASRTATLRAVGAGAVFGVTFLAVFLALGSALGSREAEREAQARAEGYTVTYRTVRGHGVSEGERMRSAGIGLFGLAALAAAAAGAAVFFGTGGKLSAEHRRGLDRMR